MKAREITAAMLLVAAGLFPMGAEGREPAPSKRATQGVMPYGASSKGRPTLQQQMREMGAPVAPVGETMAKRSSQRPIPFHGTIANVNRGGHRFTLESRTGVGRTMNITERTALTFQGAPASFGALKEGEKVRGSYWKHPNGSLEAKTVKVGPLTPAEEAAKERAKAARAARKVQASQQGAAL